MNHEQKFMNDEHRRLSLRWEGLRLDVEVASGGPPVILYSYAFAETSGNTSRR